MVLVNANGMVQVNLGLALRQVNGKSPSYDYRLTISSIPAMNLTRDRSSSGNADYGPCFISLFLQFPTFGRRTSRLGPGLSWLVSLIWLFCYSGTGRLTIVGSCLVHNSLVWPVPAIRMDFFWISYQGIMTS